MRNAQKIFTVAEAGKAAAFHRTLPSYSPTPLVALKNLAGLLGVSDIYVKDESQRFGLNAFKALGGSYCIQRCMEQKTSITQVLVLYNIPNFVQDTALVKTLR